MKAFSLSGNGIEGLRLVEVTNPEPGVNEVLIKTKAVSINPVDIATMNIEAARKALLAPVQGQPIIGGWDVAGEVIKTGKSVAGFKAGDRVFGCINFPGKGQVYAELVSAPASQLALIPEGVSFESAAAACMAALTPWQALVTHGNIKKGDKVLIHAAAGGVGHFAVQIAKSFGAYVIGTASTANIDFIKSLGVDETIDYKRQKFEEVVNDADLVLDSIDAANLLRSLDAAKPGGIVVSLKSEFDGDIGKKSKEKNITGIRMGVTSNGSDMEKIADLMHSGKMRPFIYKVFQFNDLPQAAQAMGSVAHGKIVISVK
jgi:NADPH:quinone reductase-like Zn-dependent oxidoreductase